MLAKRIIPCLDVQNGRTVKGIHFENMQDVGDPVELAVRYCREGADELMFLDITATQEKRKTLTKLVHQIGKAITIPFTIGGGISSLEDAYHLLDAGADKLSVNSAALNSPSLITDLAERFGSQCVVVAIDCKWQEDTWKVYSHGGRIETKRPVLDWAKQGVDLGAGELLVTSMTHDGSKNGFAITLINIISESVRVPIIASGGAGCKEHFEEIFTKGGADAALAAGIFHAQELELHDLKRYLKQQNIEIRL